MQPNELQQYLADQPPLVMPLKIEPHFALLTDEQKRYSHFISQYAHIPPDSQTARKARC